MNFGYLLIVAEHDTIDYLSMAYALALSIKNTQKPGYDKVALVIDNKHKVEKLKSPWVFDHVIEWDQETFWDGRSWMDQLTPFDHTVCLDADMLFIHAKDLASNILWAIDNWRSELPFMCVNEREHNIKEIAYLVAEEFGIPEERIIFDTDQPKGQHRKPARSDVPADYIFIDIRDGIRNSCNWFRYNYKEARK